ncbi:MAG: AMP-binding protein [Kiloniellales bacterium]|nr:AMP-binding protein [Kiloniellales bacterium]
MEFPRDYNAAVDFVDRHLAEGRAGKAAFVDPERALTYGELAAACNRLGNLLADAGIGREARVAMLVLDTVDFPVIFWGAIKAGVVPVALNTLLTTEHEKGGH